MSIDKIEFMGIDAFPVTPLNESQYQLCRQVLTDPGRYRLVFFQLPAHEGFHLKYALINRFGSDICRHVTISNFVRELLDAIRSGVHLSCRKYTEPEILIVDDLHHIRGKDATQEEFYRSILKQRLEDRKLTILFSEEPFDSLRLSLRDDLAHLLNLGFHDPE